jgi:hypothetical protein
MFKSGGLLTKLILILSLVTLIAWAIPTMLNYYKSVESYGTKKNELQEARIKYNIIQDAQTMKIDDFKKEVDALFSDVTIKPQPNPQGGYGVTIQIDKDKIEAFNHFIETLSLRYLVRIKDNELHFEEKDKLIEVKFILENL